MGDDDAMAGMGMLGQPVKRQP